MSGLSKVIVLDPDARACRQIQLGFQREGIPTWTSPIPIDVHRLDLFPGGDEDDASLVVVGGQTDGALELIKRTRAQLEDNHIEAPILFAGRGVRRTDAEAAGADEVVLQPAHLRDVVTIGRLLRGAPTNHRTHIVGNLAETTGVFTLVRALSALGRSAVLTLIRGLRRGEIRFFHGEVTSAQVGLIHGQAAFHQLLLWTDARFDFHHEDIVRRHQIPLAHDELFADAERFLAIVRDESGPLSPSMVLEQDVARIHELGKRIPTEVHGVLRMFDGHRVLADVLEDSPYRVFETLRVAQRALDAGLLRQTVAPRPKATWRAVLAIEEWLVGGARETAPSPDSGAIKPGEATGPHLKSSRRNKKKRNTTQPPVAIQTKPDIDWGALVPRIVGAEVGPLSGVVPASHASGEIDLPSSRQEPREKLEALMDTDKRERIFPRDIGLEPSVVVFDESTAAPSEEVRDDADWSAREAEAKALAHGAEQETHAAVEQNAKTEARDEVEKQARDEAEMKAREAAAEKAREAAEQKAREAAGEAAEQKAREAAEQKAREAAEQKAREAADAEQKAREAADAAQKAREAAEQQTRDTADGEAKAKAAELLKAQEEADAKAAAAVEAKFREQRERAEAEERAAAAAKSRVDAERDARIAAAAKEAADRAEAEVRASQQKTREGSGANRQKRSRAARRDAKRRDAAEAKAIAEARAAAEARVRAEASAIPDDPSDEERTIPREKVDLGEPRFLSTEPKPVPPHIDPPTTAAGTWTAEAKAATEAARSGSMPAVTEIDGTWSAEAKAATEAARSGSMPAVTENDGTWSAEAKAATEVARSGSMPAVTEIGNAEAKAATEAARSGTMPAVVDTPGMVVAETPSTTVVLGDRVSVTSTEKTARLVATPVATITETAGVPTAADDEPSDGVIRARDAAEETAPILRRPPPDAVPVVDDRPDDMTGEITAPRTRDPLVTTTTEPSILVADLAAVHGAVSAIADQQAAAPRSPDAASVSGDVRVDEVRKDAQAAHATFSELEEDFFRAGSDRTGHVVRPDPAESFDDLDEGYEPVGFWDRLLGRKKPRR